MWTTVRVSNEGAATIDMRGGGGGGGGGTAAAQPEDWLMRYQLLLELLPHQSTQKWGLHGKSILQSLADGCLGALLEVVVVRVASDCFGPLNACHASLCGMKWL